MKSQVSTATAILRQLGRRVALSAGLSLAVAAGASAQSFRDFSQFHLTPTLVNPANGGLDNDFKVCTDSVKCLLVQIALLAILHL
jgi:hypothetical protein